jgi:flavin-binding protein dodecin
MSGRSGLSYEQQVAGPSDATMRRANARKCCHRPVSSIDTASRCEKGCTLVYAEVSAVPESVYKVIELVGTSTESWEKAAAAAVEKAASSLRDLRIAQVAELDLQIENGVVKAYRAKVKVSFKYED